MLVGDSADPLQTYPTSWKGEPIAGWAFYIGGDTPHVWSDAEVAALPYRYRLPIFTRSDPDGTAQAHTDAAAAVAWMRAHGQPAGTLLMLDYETAVDSAYVVAFDAVVTAAGYRTVLYGSASTVVRNTRPSGGYDEADWTGTDEAPASTADQFVDEGSYDLNDFADSAPLWDTRAAAPPTQEHTVPYKIIVSGAATQYVVDGGVVTPIPNPDDSTALAAAGVAPAEPVTVSQAFLDNLVGSAPATQAQVQAAVQAGVAAALSAATGAEVTAAIEAAVAAAGQALAAKLTG